MKLSFKTLYKLLPKNNNLQTRLHFPSSFNSFYSTNIYSFATKGKAKAYYNKKLTKKKEEINFTDSYKLFENEKQSPELQAEMKKQLAVLNDIKEDSTIMTSSAVQEYNKSLDTNFEKFFHKRELTRKNYNYYLQVLSQKGLPDDAYSQLHKMKSFNFKPDAESFNHVLTAYAKTGNIEKAELVFKEAKKLKLHINKYIYNSLLLAYAKSNKVSEAESIIREMKVLGLVPDVVCYTTLINAYRLSNDIEKCWKLYSEVSFEQQPDEYLLTYMINLCAYTNDAEKAVRLYERLQMVGFTQQAKTYNSIIFALASRKDYAPKALETFIKMKNANVQPDIMTFVAVLKACACLGDINYANNVVKELKLYGLPLNKFIYNELLRTYAGACKIEGVTNKEVEKYVKDSWEIFKLYQKSFEPDTKILNSLLKVVCEAHLVEDIDGLVLPLFAKHNVKMDRYTYEHLVTAFWSKRYGDIVVHLYNQLREKGLKPTIKVLNVLLEVSLHNHDEEGILEALQTAREIKREINHKYLVMLGKMEEVPDRIYAELKEWPTYYNMNHKHRTFKKASFRKRDRKNVNTLSRKSRRKRLR